MSPGVYCIVMRLNIDCNGCCRKLRRIIHNMKEVETHMIEKEHCRLSVCGRFRPSDIAIKIRKRMNRRVEILEIHPLGGSSYEQIDQEQIDQEQIDQEPTINDPWF